MKNDLWMKGDDSFIFFYFIYEWMVMILLFYDDLWVMKDDPRMNDNSWMNDDSWMNEDSWMKNDLWMNGDDSFIYGDSFSNDDLLMIHPWFNLHGW